MVQAGGAVGRWPIALAEMFEQVYTFEPDPLNFACLVRNAAALNILKYQAALGQSAELIHMEPMEADNAGAGEVIPGGRTPTITIDSLALTDVDFMQLDVEGSEEKVLRGAAKTIKRDRPVLMLEFGNVAQAIKDSLAKYLEEIGYRHVGNVSRDKVFVYGDA